MFVFDTAIFLQQVFFYVSAQLPTEQCIESIFKLCWRMKNRGNWMNITGFIFHFVFVVCYQSWLKVYGVCGIWCVVYAVCVLSFIDDT